MATIVFCDRVRHIVRESRSEIERLISHVQSLPTGKRCTCGPQEACSECPPASESPTGFIWVTPEGSPTDTGNAQIALKAEAITSFQALPGDGT